MASIQLNIADMLAQAEKGVTGYLQNALDQGGDYGGEQHAGAIKSVMPNLRAWMGGRQY